MGCCTHVWQFCGQYVVHAHCGDDCQEPDRTVRHAVHYLARIGYWRRSAQTFNRDVLYPPAELRPAIAKQIHPKSYLLRAARWRRDDPHKCVVTSQEVRGSPIDARMWIGDRRHRDATRGDAL